MTQRLNRPEQHVGRDALRFSDHDDVQQTRRRLFRERQRDLLVQARKRLAVQHSSTSFHYCPKCGEDLKAYDT
jgi:aspartate/methionine/tyrosine aminotransferase